MKELIWLGDSLKQLSVFPEDIKDGVGYALQLVQESVVPKNAKVLKGFKPQVLELLLDGQGGTYRAVYTIKISDTVYVLHCFQKKSKQGISTPKQEIEMIKQRLKQAERIDKGHV
jgi:phage-related protein